MTILIITWIQIQNCYKKKKRGTELCCHHLRWEKRLKYHTLHPPSLPFFELGDVPGTSFSQAWNVWVSHCSQPPWIETDDNEPFLPSSVGNRPGGLEV